MLMAFTSLMLAFYPVGSIYLSATSTSPASVVGGTWNRIQGANLYACDSTVGGAVFGGSKKITVDNMPTHYHDMGVYTPDGSDTMPAWKMYIGDRWATTGVVRANGSSAQSGYTNLNTSFGNTATAGKGANYVPYSYGVYVWQRTA